jgi:folate-binding protein YgfZ
MTKSAHLDDRALLTVSGEAATEFLQNLVTCDVEKLETDATTFGALLTPQGKILFEFLVTKTTNGFFLDCRADMRDDLLKRLMFYRLRAAVDLAPERADVFVIWDDDAGTDPRSAKLGRRVYSEPIPTNASSEDWHAIRISAGVPELGMDFDASSVFPHEAMMDQYETAGVDFAKGCYVGQEVVSRMQHRSTTRSRFVHVSGEKTLPAMGSEIAAQEKKIGTMGSAVKNKGLALVRLDRAAAARDLGAKITCDDIALDLQLPEFFAGDWPS